MGRYLMKFTKMGDLKYISHLDLMRLFRRSFKRSDIQLVYSNGYNPHAKISFAQPLSLGFESTGEYVEIETRGDSEPELIAESLNGFFPEGLEILMCRSLQNEMNVAKNTSSAAVMYASYRIETASYYDVNEPVMPSIEMLTDFFNQEQIFAEKQRKKKQGRKTVKVFEKIDIKPLIDSYTLEAKGGISIINLVVNTGSKSNLNPELLIDSICDYSGIGSGKHLWNITRNEMYFVDKNGTKKSLSAFRG